MLRRETEGSPERLRAALAGLRRYQGATRAEERPARPAIATAGRASLRHCGGGGPPVVIVPSIINPPGVLDLSPDRSFVGWLAARGMTPLLLDWGAPSPDERALSLAGHVEALLLPLLDTLEEPPALIGYCLGGTLALAAAALRPTRGVALIASPWRFGNYPAAARADLAAFWAQAEPPANALGLLPMELLQAAFWSIDPARSVAKYERLGTGPVDGAALREFVRLEDWANDGPPITFGAGRELFESWFAGDATGRGAWRVGGRDISPATMSAPILDITSTVDRIVPAGAALGLGENLALDLGHVGMMVGSQAQARLWTPLADWLARSCGLA